MPPWVLITSVTAARTAKVWTNYKSWQITRFSTLLWMHDEYTPNLHAKQTNKVRNFKFQRIKISTSLWYAVAFAPQCLCTLLNVALVQSVQFDANVLNVPKLFPSLLPILWLSARISRSACPNCVASCLARASTVRLLCPDKHNWRNTYITHLKRSRCTNSWKR